MKTYMHESETTPTLENLRKISEKDLNEFVFEKNFICGFIHSFFSVTGVQVTEELSDVYSFFQLYYGGEMSRMQDWENVMRDKMDENFVPKFKMCGRTDKYLLCVQCGLEPMAKKFGLLPHEFAENFTEYVKHEIRQEPAEPFECAKEFVCENFPTEDSVIQGAIYILAQQFSREPAVRKKLRDIFRQRLKLSVYPTKKGRLEIDSNHPLWGRHYVKDKPINSVQNDEYLRYIQVG